jgi:phosphatidylglycerophosphate synthase
MTRGSQLTWDEYSARWSALHGGVDPRDPRLGPPGLASGASRRSSLLIHTWLRMSYRLGRALAATGVRPNTLTAVGVVAAVAVPVVVALAGPSGTWLSLAAGLVLVTAVADSLDGAVAVIAARMSPIGSFYDSMADRVSEAAWLVALWLLGVPGVLLVPCGALAWLHEYARARATLLGMSEVGVITVAERPTRVVLVIAAFLLGAMAGGVSPFLAVGVATVVVAVWLVMGVFGAVRLLGAIRAALASRGLR